MAYRDDLEAALARVAALEAECARLRKVKASPMVRQTVAPAPRAFVCIFLKKLAAWVKDVAKVTVGSLALLSIISAALAAVAIFLLCAGSFIPDKDPAIVAAWPLAVRIFVVAQPVVYYVTYLAIISWCETKKGAQ